MCGFGQVPYLAMKNIFKFLGLRDLARCRAVCRQFKFYADEIEIDRLVVNDYKSTSGTRTLEPWYLTERSIDVQFLITRNEFFAIGRSQFRLGQLKFLFIQLDQAFCFSTFCNQFKGLIHLKLAFGEIDYQRRTLTLPELKVLKLFSSFPCVLKTPKLEVVSFYRASNLRFEHPETIKHLECSFLDADLIGTFLNLEVFKYEDGSVNLNANLLQILKNLKELDIKNTRLDFGDELRAFWPSILKQ